MARRVQEVLLERGETVMGRTDLEGAPALKVSFVSSLATATDVRSLVAIIVDEVAGTHVRSPRPGIPPLSGHLG